MAVFKTIKQINQDIWTSSVSPVFSFKDFPPQNLKYIKKDTYDYNDIEIWEELYYKEGHIGVYAAWSPFVNCYIITHNLFLDHAAGIEVYSGKNAMEDVISRAISLGITLPLNKVWVDAVDFENLNGT